MIKNEEEENEGKSEKGRGNEANSGGDSGKYADGRSNESDNQSGRGGTDGNGEDHAEEIPSVEAQETESKSTEEDVKGKETEAASIKEAFGADAALDFLLGKKTYEQIVLRAYEEAKSQVKSLEGELQKARDTLDALAKSGLPDDERVSEGHAQENGGSLGFSDDFLKAASRLFPARGGSYG